MSEQVLGFYILPGRSRRSDRVIAAKRVAIKYYDPSKDQGLTEAERRFQPGALKCSVEGGPEEVVQFALPCWYSRQWKSIEDAARYMGRTLSVGEAVEDDEGVGRSIVSHWVAIDNGEVYETKQPSGSNLLIVRKWPVSIGAEDLAEARG